MLPLLLSSFVLLLALLAAGLFLIRRSLTADADEKKKMTKEAETVEAVKQIGELIEKKLETVAIEKTAPIVKVESVTAIQAVAEKTDMVQVQPPKTEKPHRKRAASRKHHKAAHPRNKRR
jgi:hypothetical protein